MNPEQAISEQLESGERLLWSGHPKHGLILRAGDAFLVPFSLMWGGFAIFWEVSVLRTHGSGFFALWGIPFVLVGIHMILGRFWVDAATRARTIYGLTDRRAIIISGLVTRPVKSLSLRTLTDVTLTERGNGSGTIALGQVPPWSGLYGGMRWPGMGSYGPPSFDLIPDARRIYWLIRQAQEARQ